MEEEKAAAYYDELTRKGGGAARFKQGLGFSSSGPENDAVPTKQASSSSFLSNFVKASSPTTTSNLQKKSELESIQNKLKKKPSREEQTHSSRVSSRDRERDHGDRDRERKRDYRDREKDNRHRDRDRDRDRGRDYRDRDRERRRSVSPPRERREEKRSESGKARKERTDKVDFSRLIEGYDKMSDGEKEIKNEELGTETPAERVKAKMKLQLAETAEKDETKGMGSGWERFEFDKDAPLDDEELEVADDDVALVKHIGQSFRFSAIEARREEQIKAAHDEAMFGTSAVPPSVSSDSEPEADNSEKKSNEGSLATSLLSEKVLAKQQGSWRDRARKGTSGSTLKKQRVIPQLAKSRVVSISAHSLTAPKKEKKEEKKKLSIFPVTNSTAYNGFVVYEPLVEARGTCIHCSRPLVLLWESAVFSWSVISASTLKSEIDWVNKENRAAGVLDNFAEGEKYSEHFLRKYVRNRTPEIMPSINSFFTDPK
ncbi:hypothetical protein EZV62_022868 [Acer yangbiense]|uniref:Uncharacterized protein n=1 Tax=Acer yangbiense TaxID=1000413 RepID=A0A5C7GZY0_9ROSI|nr:hypothetical protein EZV62_022868 [Acer yangbiense]